MKCPNFKIKICPNECIETFVLGKDENLNCNTDLYNITNITK